MSQYSSIEQKQLEQYRLISSLSTKPGQSKANKQAENEYPDLEAWLELTGYHNEQYRAACLKWWYDKKELEKSTAALDAEYARMFPVSGA